MTAILRMSAPSSSCMKRQTTHHFLPGRRGGKVVIARHHGNPAGMGPGNDLFGSAGTEKGFHVQRVDLAAFAKASRRARHTPRRLPGSSRPHPWCGTWPEAARSARLPKRKKSLKHGRLIHAGRAAEHVYPPFGHVGGKRGKPLRLLAQTGQVGRGERNNDAGTPLPTARRPM